MTSRVEKLLLLLLFIIAFTLRFYYHRDTLALSPQQPDGFYYHRLAENVLRGRGYSIIWATGHQYNLFRPPGYPIFLASIYSLFGINYAAVRLIQIALSSASVLVLFFLTLRIFGRKAAWGAAVLASFYWRSVLWSGIYRAETIFVLFLLISLYFLVANARGGSGKVAPLILSGFFLGISYLIRPNIIGVVPWLALWLWARLIGSRVRRAGIVALYIAFFGVTVSPWILYNYCATHISPGDSLSTTMGAVNMWMGQTPAMGDEVDNRGFEMVNSLRFKNYGLGEREWIALLRTQTRQFIAEDPVRCLKMALRRFKKHWLAAGVMDGEGTIYPDSGRNRYGILYFYERFWKPGAYIRDNVWVTMEYKKRLTIGGVWIPLVTFEGVFDICVFGLIAALILCRGRLAHLLGSLWSRSSLLLIFTAGYSLFSLFGHSHHRLRFPLEWLALAYAGWGIGNILELFPSLRRQEATPADYPPPRCAYIFAIIPITAFFFLFTIRHTITATSAHIRAICQAPSQKQQARTLFGNGASDPYRQLQSSVGFREVWRYQMEHAGDIGKYRGAVVCWEGEATYLREISTRDLEGENAPYQEAWKLAGPGGTHPLFMRLVVGSYDNPSSLGEGEVLVICDRKAAESVKEGDRVTILAEISGADTSGMGYIIAFGHAVYRWHAS